MIPLRFDVDFERLCNVPISLLTFPRAPDPFIPPAVLSRGSITRSSEELRSSEEELAPAPICWFAFAAKTSGAAPPLFSLAPAQTLLNAAKTHFRPRESWWSRRVAKRSGLASTDASDCCSLARLTESTSAAWPTRLLPPVLRPPPSTRLSQQHRPHPSKRPQLCQTRTPSLKLPTSQHLRSKPSGRRWGKGKG